MFSRSNWSTLEKHRRRRAVRRRTFMEKPQALFEANSEENEKREEKNYNAWRQAAATTTTTGRVHGSFSRKGTKKFFFLLSIAKNFGLKNLILQLSSNLYSFHVVDKSEQNLRLNSTSEKKREHNGTIYAAVLKVDSIWMLTSATTVAGANYMYIWQWHEWFFYAQRSFPFLSLLAFILSHIVILSTMLWLTKNSFCPCALPKIKASQRMYDSWRHNCGIESNSIVWCCRFPSLYRPTPWAQKRSHLRYNVSPSTSPTLSEIKSIRVRNQSKSRKRQAVYWRPKEDVADPQ